MPTCDRQTHVQTGKQTNGHMTDSMYHAVKTNRNKAIVDSKRRPSWPTQPNITRTKTRPPLTCAENLVKFGYVVLEISEQTDAYTDTQTC